MRLVGCKGWAVLRPDPALLLCLVSSAMFASFDTSGDGKIDKEECGGAEAKSMLLHATHYS